MLITESTQNLFPQLETVCDFFITAYCNKTVNERKQYHLSIIINGLNAGNLCIVICKLLCFPDIHTHQLNALWEKWHQYRPNQICNAFLDMQFLIQNFGGTLWIMRSQTTVKLSTAYRKSFCLLCYFADFSYHSYNEKMDTEFIFISQLWHFYGFHSFIQSPFQTIEIVISTK